MASLRKTYVWQKPNTERGDIGMQKSAIGGQAHSVQSGFYAG